MVEAVANHIATHLDEPSVFHEVVSDLVHVDVHCVPPGEGRQWIGVVPLYEDEMDFKLEKGAEALFDLFDEHEVTELVAPDRPSVVPHRRGLFRR